MTEIFIRNKETNNLLMAINFQEILPTEQVQEEVDKFIFECEIIIEIKVS